MDQGKGRAWGIAAAVLGLALMAPAASAQTKEELDRARTDFQQGVALMAANNCAAALAKFQAVAKVKRTPQVLFNIAECEERLGKLVSSLGNYRLAAAAAEGDRKAKEVAAQVGDRIAAIEQRIPKLTIRRGDGAETATILLDSVELGTSETATEMPVDPGSHAVVAKVGDREAFRETVTLEEGGAKTVDVVIEVLEDTTPPDVTNPQPIPETPKDEGSSSTPGIVVLSVGIASGVAGAVFMGLRQGAISELDEECGGDDTCPPSAEEIADRGKLFTGLAEVTIGLGVVGIVTGIVLIATSGGDEKAAPADGAPSEEPSSEARRRRGGVARGWYRPRVVASAPGADVGGFSVIGRF